MTLLKLDFDGALPRGFVATLTTFAKLWRWPLEAVRYDRTRRGWHVTVGVRKKIPPPLVVAAQAILGSDPKREAFNVMRVQRLDKVSPFWRARWNVLYSSHSRGVSINGTH